MSSLRKIESARANGARSHGPVTAEGKQRSAQNAMRHGLLARSIVLENETREGFDALFELHLDRLKPADGVEFGFIEEMVSSYWRMRRAWAIETRLMQKRLDDQPGADELDRLAGAFENLAASQSIGLIHRYETRLHCMYQRALKNLLLLRKAGMPNEPNPISEHSPSSPAGPPAPSPQPMAPNPTPSALAARMNPPSSSLRIRPGGSRPHACRRSRRRPSRGTGYQDCRVVRGNGGLTRQSARYGNAPLSRPLCLDDGERPDHGRLCAGV